MTKLRKQRRKKKFRHNVNRKRLRNKLFGEKKMACKEIEEAWQKNRSVRFNLEDMGLSYDPNKTLKITQTNDKLKNKANSSPWSEEETENKPIPSKVYIAEALEKDANAPRVKLFRLPKGQVQWITYLMDKYGHDFKAMAKDKKNHYQETWKQLRAKVKRFMTIPEQYSQYLEERGLLDSEGNDETDPNNLNINSDSDSD